MSQNPTNLAGGQRRAQFVIGANVGDEVELKNISTEARDDSWAENVEKVDRTRHAKKITPKGDMLWVRRTEAENLSAGGLIIPDEGKDRPLEGTVISVGRKVEDIKEGEHVIFGRYSGTEYPWGDELLLFMREDEIIATVED
jgi:chaperonin GroES